MSTLTLNLDERHDAVLTSLAAEQEMSKTALLRTALRLYQTIHIEAKRGRQLAFQNADGSFVSLVMLGGPMAASASGLGGAVASSEAVKAAFEADIANELPLLNDDKLIAAACATADSPLDHEHIARYLPKWRAFVRHLAEQGNSGVVEAEQFIDAGLADVQDESGFSTYYSKSAVLECINAALEHVACEKVITAQKRIDGIEVPGLHPVTVDLVRRFSRALAEKLAAAEEKYGYSDGWLQTDWMDECRTKLLEHVAKGDPRDVAAYCAFLWHHGESTAAPRASQAATEAQPMFFVSAEQANALEDRPGDNEGGRYLPVRKTAAGKFTMPLYASQPGCAVEGEAVDDERRRLRAQQSEAVMPQIGPLLDAWEGVDNDTKGVIREQAPALARHLGAINRAMEDDAARAALQVNSTEMTEGAKGSRTDAQ